MITKALERLENYASTESLYEGQVDRLREIIEALRQSLAAGGDPKPAQVDGWRPIESAPKEAPYWVVWSAYYQRPVVVTQRSNDNTYWEGDWDFDVQATHWTAALALKPEPRGTAQGGEG